MEKLSVFVIHFYIVSFIDDDEVDVRELVGKILEYSRLKRREKEMIFHSSILFREDFIFI